MKYPKFWIRQKGRIICIMHNVTIGEYYFYKIDRNNELVTGKSNRDLNITSLIKAALWNTT